jgi:hypothetical protein
LKEEIYKWTIKVLYILTIQNTYFAFGSKHMLSKTLESFHVIRVENWITFCYSQPFPFNHSRFLLVNSSWASGYLQNGSGYQRNQPCDYRIAAFSPTPWLLRRGKGVEIETISNGQWLKQSCLCNGSSVKTLNKGDQRVSSGT